MTRKPLTAEDVRPEPTGRKIIEAINVSKIE